MHSISFVGFLSKIHNLSLISRKHLKPKLRVILQNNCVRVKRNKEEMRNSQDWKRQEQTQEQNETWILKWKGHWGEIGKI